MSAAISVYPLGPLACSQRNRDVYTHPKPLWEPHSRSLVRSFSVPQPLCDAQQEKQRAEGEAHEGDDESEPTGIGGCAETRVAAENGEEQENAEQTDGDHGAAPLQELAGSIVGGVTQCVVVNLLTKRHWMKVSLTS